MLIRDSISRKLNWLYLVSNLDFEAKHFSYVDICEIVEKLKLQEIFNLVMMYDDMQAMLKCVSFEELKKINNITGISE